MFVYVWVGFGFFLSLLTSSYDAINMFFHVYKISQIHGYSDIYTPTKEGGFVINEGKYNQVKQLVLISNIRLFPAVFSEL